MLERLRFRSEATQGRRRPEAEHPYRDPFERDRDRIVHSRAFRRLKHKTQVFTTPLCDHFRDRLTHSVEVSQVARTVATTLGLNERLVEALALGHDLGHPPFGHAGEEALDAQMRRFGARFDHNLNALHVADRFERRYAAFPGLNLTFEVREGLLKHSRDYGVGEAPEAEQYLPGLRPPLEAQLIDPADEIAYGCADLEDALEAGVVTLEEARAALPFLDEAVGEIARRWPHADERTLCDEAHSRLVEALVSSLIRGTEQAAVAAGVETLDDVRRLPSRLAQLDSPHAELQRNLKLFLTKTIYRSAGLEIEGREVKRKVAEVFAALLDEPERLPEGRRRLLDDTPAPQVVCDYVAGMTDDFLLRFHERLDAPADAAGALDESSSLLRPR